MDISFETEYGVSRETFNNLQLFADMLKERNQKVNLVSRKSVDDLWNRHILNSAQLINYIPGNTRTLLDIGSGAGFPGMVLAILMAEKMSAAKIILTESIGKKAAFLNDVKNELKLDNAVIKNDRVETLNNVKPDIITARAVASLDILCGYAYKLSGKNTESLFLKGKSYKEELAEAAKNWKFVSEVYPDKYLSDGVVLKLTRIRKAK